MLITIERCMIGSGNVPIAASAKGANVLNDRGEPDHPGRLAAPTVTTIHDGAEGAVIGETVVVDLVAQHRHHPLIDQTEQGRRRLPTRRELGRLICNDREQFPVVPEPSTWAIMLLGVVWLALVRVAGRPPPPVLEAPSGFSDRIWDKTRSILLASTLND
jgi:hypothetical protein